jgi:hypothetical protein
MFREAGFVGLRTLGTIGVVGTRSA